MFYTLEINVIIYPLYFINSVKKIFNDKFITYKSYDFILEDANDSLWKVNENNDLCDYYCNTDQEYDIVYNYTLNKIKKIVFYLKNTNPEFGQDWSIEFNQTENPRFPTQRTQGSPRREPKVLRTSPV